MLVGDSTQYLTAVATFLLLAVHGARPDELVQVSVSAPVAFQSSNASAEASFTQLQATVEEEGSIGASEPGMLPLVWHWVPKHDDMTPYNAFSAIQHHLQSSGSKCFGWHAADADDVMHLRHGLTALEDLLTAVPKDGKHAPEWRVTLVCKSPQGVVFSLGVDWKHSYNAATNQHPLIGFHVWHRLQLPRSTTRGTHNGMLKLVFAKIWTNLRNEILQAAPGGDDPTIVQPVQEDATSLALQNFENQSREEAKNEIKARKREEAQLLSAKHSVDAM